MKVKKVVPSRDNLIWKKTPHCALCRCEHKSLQNLHKNFALRVHTGFAIMFSKPDDKSEVPPNAF